MVRIPHFAHGGIGDPLQAKTDAPATYAVVRRSLRAAPRPRPALTHAWTDAEATIQGFCEAARVGDTARVTQLLTKDPALVHAPFAWDNARRAIHYAAREGQAETVETLLAFGADPLEGVWPYPDSTSALELAEARGHDEVVRLIREWLAVRRSDAEKGERIAALIKNDEKAALSAALNADASAANAPDFRGETPLFHAVRHGGLVLVRELLQRGADPEARNKQGRKPLHEALVGPERPFGQQRVPNGALVLAGVLLGHGAEYDLWTAAALGDLSAVENLATLEPHHVNSFRGYGLEPHPIGFPLSIAALHGHLEIVRALLNQGADPDASIEHRFEEGQREFGAPLVFAAAAGHLEIVRLLLQRGANPNTQLFEDDHELFGRTPVYEALRRNDGPMLELLYRYGAVGQIHAYAMAGRIDVVSEMLAGMPQLAGEVISIALWKGDPDLVRRAIEYRPKLEREEWYRLMWFAMDRSSTEEAGDQLEAFEVVLAHGIDPNTPDYEGITLLHRIAECRGLSGHRRVQFARMLVEHGARLNVRESEFGATPLAWAVRFGRRELVEFYLKRRAAVRLPDDSRWSSAIAWAERTTQTEILRMLLDAEAKQG